MVGGKGPLPPACSCHLAARRSPSESFLYGHAQLFDDQHWIYLDGGFISLCASLRGHLSAEFAKPLFAMALAGMAGHHRIRCVSVSLSSSWRLQPVVLVFSDGHDGYGAKAPDDHVGSSCYSYALPFVLEVLRKTSH